MEKNLPSKADVTRWLKELRDAIPKGSESITPRTLEIWSERLSRVPMTVLVVVANLLAERNTFFPSLAEILEVCKEVTDRADERRWRSQLAEAKREALSPEESRKMLVALHEAAANPNRSSLIPFRKSVKEILSEPPKQHEIGVGMTDEEWENRKLQARASAKSLDEEPRSVRGKEVSTPNSGGGRGA